MQLAGSGPSWVGDPQAKILVSYANELVVEAVMSVSRSVHWRQLGGEALPHTLTRFPGSQIVQLNHRQRVTPPGL